MRYTSGVVTGGAGADSRFQNTYIRGFLADQYLDSLKLVPGAFAVPQIDVYTLQQIDVIHGPASVLYGNGSPGGIIDMISKRPLAEPFHEVFTQFGNYGLMVGGFDMTGPIDKDGKLLYRLTGVGRQNNTQVDFTEYQRGTIAPSLTWRPTADTTWTILTQFQDEPKAGFFNQLPVRGTALFNPFGSASTHLYSGEPGYDKYQRTQDHVESLFEHRFNDVLTVRQNFRYMNVHADVNLVYPTGLQANLQLINRSVFTTTERLYYLTADNQAEANFYTGPIKHTILAGADYQTVQDTKVNGGGTAPALNMFNPIYGRPIPAPVTNLSQKQDQNQEGYYVQDQAQFGRVFGIASIRQDHVGTVTNNLLARTAVEEGDKATTKRGGLLYLFDGGLAPYIQYTKSFQPTIGTTFNGTPFVPTTGRQNEVGIKYEPPGPQKILATFAAFDLVQHNVLTPDPLRPLFSVQTGAIQSRGLEFETKATLSEGLNLIASYTYFKSARHGGERRIVGQASCRHSTEHGSDVGGLYVPPWAARRVRNGGRCQVLGAVCRRQREFVLHSGRDVDRCRGSLRLRISQSHAQGAQPCTQRAELDGHDLCCLVPKPRLLLWPATPSHRHASLSLVRV